MREGVINEQNDESKEEEMRGEGIGESVIEDAVNSRFAFGLGVVHLRPASNDRRRGRASEVCALLSAL